MFRGMNTVSLDAKGRLAMPARYRERLSNDHGGRLVVTIDLDTRHRCLSLYLPAEWEKIERQIDGMSGLNEHVRRMKHLLIGHANDLDLDRNGRVLLPQELRRYAGLEKQVCSAKARNWKSGARKTGCRSATKGWKKCTNREKCPKSSRIWLCKGIRR